MRSDQKSPKKPPEREKAIALQYADLDQLPTISASGIGEIAKKILSLASKHDIPIESNKELADMLSKLRIGDSISSESYKLVAEVIAFLYHIDRKWREEHRFLDVVADVPEEDEE